MAAGVKRIAGGTASVGLTDMVRNTTIPAMGRQQGVRRHVEGGLGECSAA
jgi:hypothetical protein